jgi:hypothetical protein
MAEGMNLQKGTGAVMRLSLPWTPSAIQQENGRGLRQGNDEKNVELNTFLTRGSFDQLLKATLKRKESWLDPLMAGKVDEAKNLDSGMIFDPYEIEIALSDDPDAARLRAEVAKKEAQDQLTKDQKNRTLSTFNQYQNIAIQYSRMNPGEQSGEMGQAAFKRMNFIKQSLANDKNFEHKGLLDGFKPAYVQSKTGTIIPQDSYVSGLDGNWQEKGIWKIIGVDPVDRKLTIKNVFNAGKTGYGAPSIGEEEEIGYNDIPKTFNFGMATIAPPEEEMMSQTLKQIKSFSEVNAFTPEFISNHKDDILKQLAEDTSLRTEKIPVINRKSGKLELVDTSEVTPPGSYLLKEAEDEAKDRKESGITGPGFYGKELAKKLAQYEKVTRGELEPYFPIDPQRWKEDILGKAAIVRAKAIKQWNDYHNKGYREPEPWEKIAQDIWGYGWPKIAQHTLKDQKLVPVEEPEEEQ